VHHDLIWIDGGYIPDFARVTLDETSFIIGTIASSAGERGN
jgi:hypothetical protein